MKESYMNFSSGPFVTSKRMNIYDPLHQISSWLDGFRDDNISGPALLDFEDRLDNQSEDTSHGALTPTHKYEQESSRSSEKVQRRLAQNREAARKSRLRKKAYVQQLESSRIKLIQLEQELERARQQGFCVGSTVDHLPSSSTSNTNTGISAFDMEYGNWLEEQKKQVCELRASLQAHKTEAELSVLVDANMKHYTELFCIKGNAAKANVFYVMSGMWKSPAERFFFWIGGFRPSELLKVRIQTTFVGNSQAVLAPLMEPLSEKQRVDVGSLTQSCQQAEDALSQGMERLQQTLAESVAAGQVDEGSYVPQMTIAVEKLDALVSFVTQADHLRQEALQQMQRILTIRQAARCLLLLGEYFQRLIALSSLWASRSGEPA
ncbi:hypothetical protein V2J09_016384 [Rumex salicifolius]